MEAADGWGLSGAWSPESESSEEVLAELLADGVDGGRPAARRAAARDLSAGQVDGLTSTSAPAVASLLRTADDQGATDALLTALCGPVVEELPARRSRTLTAGRHPETDHPRAVGPLPG